MDVNFISPLSYQLKVLKEIHSRIIELFFSIITFIKVTDSGCQQRLPSVMKWKSLFRKRKREVRSTVIHSFIDNQRAFCLWHIVMLEWMYTSRKFTISSVLHKKQPYKIFTSNYSDMHGKFDFALSSAVFFPTDMRK